MSKMTMALIAAVAFGVAAGVTLAARMTIVLPVAFGLAAVALAVRAAVLWRARP